MARLLNRRSLMALGGLLPFGRAQAQTPITGPIDYRNLAAPDFTISPTGGVSIGDVTRAVVSLANGGVARANTDRFSDVFNIRDRIAGVGQGSQAADTAAMTSAIAYATVHPGTAIVIPGGAYRFTPPSTGFLLPDRTSVIGAGQQKTLITWDDTLGFNLFAGAGTSSAMVNDIVLRDFTVQGSWLTNGNASAYPLLVNFVNGLSFLRLTVEYSRVMSIVSRGSIDVIAQGCTVRYSGRDGINFAQCANISILDNIVEHTDDDGIAAHSNNIDPWGVRKNIAIVGNRMFDTQGIKVLAARQTVIAGNTLDCVKAQGINVQTIAPSGATPQEGVTAMQSLVITGNSITNCIKRNNIDNLNQSAPGIIITGSSARAGTYNAVPGEADHTNAVVIDPYKEFKANSSAATVPTMGSWGIVITGNTIARTLPACNGSDPRFTKFSDFGFGKIFVRGGWADPSLAEDDFRDNAIQLGSGVLRDVLITGNQIRGMVAGLVFNTATRMENVSFRDNQCIDILSYGVLVNCGPSCILRSYVEGNLFDMDPFHKHPNRGPNGTWLAAGNPAAIQAQSGFGVIVRGNLIKNASRDASINTAVNTAGWLFENNLVEADPVQVGFSTSNKGVGVIEQAGGTWLVNADCDPASATFGTIFTANQNQALSEPTTGKWLQGTFVRNAGTPGSPPLLGWLRATTGSGNVDGTDWLAIYASTGTTGSGNGLFNQVTATGGVVTSGTNAGASAFSIVNGANATTRIWQVRTAGSPRWDLGGNNVSEPGGGLNQGTQFVINRYDDTGARIDSPFTIDRNTGLIHIAAGGMTIAGPIFVSGGPTMTSGTGAATGTQPKGSVFMRTDGAVGSTIYISQGAGVWNAVAGV